ncbi:hypothetical protein B0H94_104201 [Salsuginibacillus halophilus]|uniref:DUF8042 domain-containing protein n=1 Tax=Salsuginibacillus halophilus TaxID=517424 RepID=A0A2P8HQU8_9BACI|nr:hypothetical protein [Salsuginibacillus halophilus]PSL48600.1 hypothetical protein B0H94_104201 [Salsuginibacillus halophilus]
MEEELRDVLQKSLDLSDTIKEGAEHAKKLLDSETPEHSVPLLEDVSRALQAVQSALGQIDPQVFDAAQIVEEGERVDAALSHVADALQAETYGSAKEVMQFTLLPRLNAWRDMIYDALTTEVSP